MCQTQTSPIPQHFDLCGSFEASQQAEAFQRLAGRCAAEQQILGALATVATVQGVWWENLQESPIFQWENLWFPVEFTGKIHGFR